MAARSVAFRQADIKRAVAGAAAAGLTVGRIEITKDTIVIIPAAPGGQQSEATDALDNWIARNAR
jgi:hypothetical protein